MGADVCCVCPLGLAFVFHLATVLCTDHKGVCSHSGPSDNPACNHDGHGVHVRGNNSAYHHGCRHDDCCCVHHRAEYRGDAATDTAANTGSSSHVFTSNNTAAIASRLFVVNTQPPKIPWGCPAGRQRLHTGRRQGKPFTKSTAPSCPRGDCKLVSAPRRVPIPPCCPRTRLAVKEEPVPPFVLQVFFKKSIVVIC